MKKKLYSLILLGLFAVSRFAVADPSIPITAALERAGYPEWMSSYMAGTLDSSNSPSFGIFTHVEPAGTERYKVLIEGYVNIGTEPGFDYLTRILPERLDVVKAYFEYWCSLGYDVDFVRDVVLDIRTIK